MIYANNSLIYKYFLNDYFRKNTVRSLFLSGNRAGTGASHSYFSPAAFAESQKRRKVFSNSFASRMTPLFGRARRPTSNCGLKSAINSPFGLISDAKRQKRSQREIKLRSTVIQSKESPANSEPISLTFTPSQIVIRGSRRSSGGNAMVTSTAVTCAAPCRNRQSVKPPFAAPMSRQILSFTDLSQDRRAFSSFKPPNDAYFNVSTITIESSESTSREGLLSAMPSLVTPPVLMTFCARVRETESFSDTKTSSRTTDRLHDRVCVDAVFCTQFGGLAERDVRVRQRQRCDPMSRCGKTLRKRARVNDVLENV